MSGHEAEAWRKGYEPTVEYGWHCLTCGKEASTFTAEAAEALAAKHMEAARRRVQSAPTPLWLLVLTLVLHLAAQYTWLAGIPGAEPVTALLLIGCVSWNFAVWLADRVVKS